MMLMACPCGLANGFNKPHIIPFIFSIYIYIYILQQQQQNKNTVIQDLINNKHQYNIELLRLHIKASFNWKLIIIKRERGEIKEEQKKYI